MAVGVSAQSRKNTGSSRSRSVKKPGVQTGKRYVLDTNVLLHDPSSIFNFREHDIYLPMVVIEELDRHKKGVTDTARNARQVARLLDRVMSHGDGTLETGFELREASEGGATGRLYIMSSAKHASTVAGLEADKADNVILECTRALRIENPLADVFLVSKDINLRIKGMAVGVPVQDYRNDRILSDEDVLSTGAQYIDSAELAQYFSNREGAIMRQDGRTRMVLVGTQWPLNSFLIERTSDSQTESSDRIWRVIAHDEVSNESVIQTIMRKDTQAAIPYAARNVEQEMALDLLYDKNLDCVSLLGPAGTGKTLMSVAAGLDQVLAGRYSGVLITRITVPVGEDIGFLPGTEQDKMDPWIGGTLRDVFSALNMTDEKHPARQKVEVASMSFMRGRSFHDKYIILEEAQNYNSRQMRTLLTRAGNGSKIVLTGNNSQIDSAYIDEATSGLTWAVKTLQNWQHAGHLILSRGERSRLASYVEQSAQQNEA